MFLGNMNKVDAPVVVCNGAIAGRKVDVAILIGDVHL